MSIAFLFGAGAEADFGICTGNEFAKMVIGIDHSLKDINVAIQTFYTEVLKKCKPSKEHTNWYPEKCYPQKYNIDTLLKNAIMKSKLSSNNFPLSVDSFSKDINEQAKNIPKSDREKYIYSSPNYMGILDANFHSIISPRALGPNKFWSVVFSITRAYIAICKDILGVTPKKEECLELLSSPYDTYQKITSTIKSDRRFINNNYYLIIRTIAEEYKESIDFITTNYTPIAEIIIGSHIGKKAYIHGQINLFESPYYLQVLDMSKASNMEKYKNEINFPYLFLQSGVKPIVEQNQIRSFYNALNILDNNVTLFVLGYDFNGDDNHLNSILHTYLHEKNNDLTRKNKIIFFDYSNDGQHNSIKEQEKKLFDRLRIPENNRSGVKKIKIEIQQIDKKSANYMVYKTIKETLNETSSIIL